MPSLKDLAEEMSKLELEYAERIRASAAGVRNPAIRAAMEAVAQDSVKHSMIYKAIAEMLRGGPLIGEAEEGRIAREVEEHIRVEQEMIERVEGFLKEDLGEPVKFLLQSILEDERRHHALLRAVHEVLVRGETLTEQDLWEMTWKESLWHGAPGG